ncbi:MAG: hypothetical protein ACJ72Z_04690 [Pyrinomonadaceae bacterium]
MHRVKQVISVFSLAILAAFSISTAAQPQRINTKEVRDTIRDLNMKIVDFQNRLSYQLESSSADQQPADQVMADLRQLQSRVRAFDQDVAGRRDNRDSVYDILDTAQRVNDFMTRTRQYRALENDWNSILGQLDSLSANYGVAAHWAGGTTTGNRRQAVPVNISQDTQPVSNSPLTGTFQIDPARSEKIADVLSSTGIAATQRKDIETKLEAPEEIAIYVRGDQVTLASSKASPVTFTADGSERTETANGRTVRIRSTLRGDKLTVTSLGGSNDYTITFEPVDGGRTMKVTRRITTDYLNETLFAESVYTRTSATAGLGIRAGSDGDTAGGGYSSNDPDDAPVPTRNPQPQRYPGNQVPVRQRVGEFVVPNGTVLVGTLESTIDTKVSQNNDRFRMVIQTPVNFRGAIVEGHLSGIDRSGRVLGRTTVTFNFDRITMPDGKVYDFAGSLQRLVDQSGRVIPVDNEGTARGKDKNRDTATRGGIGAGIGAIIGAIAGGGSGAAVGAMIGGGVGAGSVYAEGGGDMQLSKGTSMTVQSSSPIR